MIVTQPTGAYHWQFHISLVQLELLPLISQNMFERETYDFPMNVLVINSTFSLDTVATCRC